MNGSEAFKASLQSNAKKKETKKRQNGFEEWGGYMASKKAKLASQFNNQRSIVSTSLESVPSKIFDSVSIYVNGYTKPTADELKRLMSIHGGTYHHYYNPPKTTHMIASNLPDSKIKALKHQKVVKPEWITDSIEAGRLLSYTKYILYTPEVTSRQHQLDFPVVSPDSTINTPPVPPLPNEHSEAIEADCYLGNSASELDMSMMLHSSQDAVISNIPVDFGVSTSVSLDISTTAATTKSNVEMKAGHPDFISEFYNHSRLHHISTAGQDLKLYIQKLASEQKGKPFARREALRSQYSSEPKSSLSPLSKAIMHLDMDCFFVSVGLRKHPEFRNFPVAVAHSKGQRTTPQEGSDVQFEFNFYKQKFGAKSSSEQTGNTVQEEKDGNSINNIGSLSEIASCNYLARDFGLRNGMSLGKALKLCPNLKILPYDFEAYSEVSKQLYDTVASFTLDIEAVSCDELYIDCNELLCDIGISVSDFATRLRSNILEITGCTSSAGMGGNMLLARLATRIAKPNGQYMITEEMVQPFIQEQKVKDLPGVGYSTSSKLEQLGIFTCGDLQMWSLSKLQQEFGNKKGQTLYDQCRGKDERAITFEKDRKSVSAEINYGIRFDQEKDIFEFLSELANEVHQRLRKICKKGRLITLKLMIRRPAAPKETAKYMGHGVCDSISKSTLLMTATDDPKIIAKECCSITRGLRILPQDYRGVGIQITKLESVSAGSNSICTIANFISNNGASTSANSKQLMPSNGVISSPKKSNTLKQLWAQNEMPKSETVPATVTPYIGYALDELDQSVLNSLPNELKQEVLNACAQKTTESNLPLAEASDMGESGTAAATDQITLFPISNSKSCGSSMPNASLGGAIRIDDIRNLIKEWVHSVSCPAVEDVDQFKLYLFQLIEENLEMTDIILKYFYRLVSSASEYWRETYLTLLSYVQQKMLQEFGYMIKVKSDFSAT